MALFWSVLSRRSVQMTGLNVWENVAFVGFDVAVPCLGPPRRHAQEGSLVAVATAMLPLPDAGMQTCRGV